MWEPFWETIKPGTTNNEQILKAGNTAIPINPLDIIFSETSYDGSGSGSATFYVEDTSTGQTASFTKGADSGGASTYYDGTSADFITESPGGQYLPFSAFLWENASYKDYYGNTYGASNDLYGNIVHTNATPPPVTGGPDYIDAGYLDPSSNDFSEQFISCN